MEIMSRCIKLKKSEFKGPGVHGMRFSGKTVLQKWFFQKKNLRLFVDVNFF